jgi:hypothetical protein
MTIAIGPPIGLHATSACRHPFLGDVDGSTHFRSIQTPFNPKSMFVILSG